MYTSMFIVLYDILNDHSFELTPAFCPFLFFFIFTSSIFLQENVESLYDRLIWPFIIRFRVLLRGILGESHIFLKLHDLAPQITLIYEVQSRSVYRSEIKKKNEVTISLSIFSHNYNHNP